MPCGCRGGTPALTPEQEQKLAAVAEERARLREERKMKRENDVRVRREFRENARRAAIEARQARAAAKAEKEPQP